jgi:hypothetical protein
VNEGIDKMKSTMKFVRVLNKCGKNCKFVKLDWSAAYKQVESFGRRQELAIL